MHEDDIAIHPVNRCQSLPLPLPFPLPSPGMVTAHSSHMRYRQAHEQSTRQPYEPGGSCPLRLGPVDMMAIGHSVTVEPGGIGSPALGQEQLQPTMTNTSPQTILYGYWILPALYLQPHTTDDRSDFCRLLNMSMPIFPHLTLIPRGINF